MTAVGRVRAKKAAPQRDIDWRRIAYLVIASRAMDEVEETTNKNRTSVPKEHLVLYQFSARGHDVGQVILGSFLDHHHDAAGAYYRSRPLLITLGLSLEDAMASPLGRSGGFSDGRDIGVVCNLPSKNGPIVLPMSGDVGSQYTPSAGWAQAIQYHRDTLGDDSYKGAMSVVLGGEASVATNGFWSALTMATTLKLPMLFYIEDNGLGISVKGEMQTPGGNIADNLASFQNLMIRDGDGCNPGESAALIAECVEHVRGGEGPALVHLTVPRLCSHSGPDNQRGYRTDREIADDEKRDPLPALQRHLVPDMLSAAEWREVEAEAKRDVETALAAARARPGPDAATVKKYIYAEESEPTEALGGLSRQEIAKLPSTTEPAEGDVVRFAEAVRKTLARELEVNPKVLVFGEDVGRKGGVHLVTEGLQKKFGEMRVFDTSLSEEGIIGRSVGMAISGLMPVTEIQFRKYADPATEQLNNCGTMRWRTANRFAAPIVVRMPGGFGKDVGDPWHSLSSEVTWAHAIGWQVIIPSNAADAVGLLRSAMRSSNPSIFFEHRSLLMTSDGSARYPGDDYVIPLGKGNVLTEGKRISVITWGAMVHRCVEAAENFEGDIDLIDLRTIAPWDRALVVASVKKTGRCLIVHEDTTTAGFGAEIAAVLASECFWFLDAPVERLTVDDVPMPYHPDLLNAVLPDASRIARRIEQILGA
ncbi:MAG: thiamine pyrophosphate-dependent enzyme [Gemmatimonadota bacterium]|nr:thiamine pyrophosphate-dependent enzyme [Gemmatimonadota bacterium]